MGVKSPSLFVQIQFNVYMAYLTVTEVKPVFETFPKDGEKIPAEAPTDDGVER